MGTTNKKIIGIVGGIASGKSSVTREFEKLGCAVIDADQIAHQFLSHQKVIDRIEKAFGNSILDEDGRIIRHKLARIVFANKEKTDLINSIIHPLVDRKCKELIDEYNGSEKVKAIILDVPLLAEVGWHRRCDAIIFVDCDEKIRHERAMKRNNASLECIKNREKLQISLDKKAEMSHYSVRNNSEMSAIAEQVKRVFSIILNTNQV